LPKHAGDDLAIALDSKFAVHDVFYLHTIVYPSDCSNLSLSSWFAHLTIEFIAKKALPLMGINYPWSVVPGRLMA
jgi:hypothetical protein